MRTALLNFPGQSLSTCNQTWKAKMKARVSPGALQGHQYLRIVPSLGSLNKDSWHAPESGLGLSGEKHGPCGTLLWAVVSAWDSDSTQSLHRPQGHGHIAALSQIAAQCSVYITP